MVGNFVFFYPETIMLDLKVNPFLIPFPFDYSLVLVCIIAGIMA